MQLPREKIKSSRLHAEPLRVIGCSALSRGGYAPCYEVLRSQPCCWSVSPCQASHYPDPTSLSPSSSMMGGQTSIRPVRSWPSNTSTGPSSSTRDGRAYQDSCRGSRFRRCKLLGTRSAATRSTTLTSPPFL